MGVWCKFQRFCQSRDEGLYTAPRPSSPSLFPRCHFASWTCDRLRAASSGLSTETGGGAGPGPASSRIFHHQDRRRRHHERGEGILMEAFLLLYQIVDDYRSYRKYENSSVMKEGSDTARDTYGAGGGCFGFEKYGWLLSRLFLIEFSFWRFPTETLQP